MPTVSIDYFFMGPSGQEEAQDVLPMLAVKSHESRMTFAHVRCRRHHDLRDLCGCWHRDCHIAREVHQLPPRRASVKRGTIEVTVREIQKQVRVMKRALEERMKCEVPARHPILAFLVEHAGRRTAHELHAGEPYRRQLVDFGERVYFMPIRPGDARQAKLDPKWQDGAFTGIRDRSDEMLTITPTGVYKTRNVRRRPELEALGLRDPHDVEGHGVEPESAGGRDGS